jgi:glycosyltransferase involved in cell wall biosynthesis
MSIRNILLVARWPVGGIRTHLKYVYPLLYTRLPQLQITCIVPRTDQAEILERDLAALPVKYIYLPRSCSARSITGAVNEALRLGSFDLVHSHGFTAACASAPVTKLRRVPHLTTVHDIVQDSQFRGLKGVAKKVGMRVLLRMVDRVHAVSGDVKENLACHFGRGLARRVRVVRNGILTRPVLEATASGLRSELQMDPKTLLIGFFGRFMGQKGFRYLIEAVRLLRQQLGIEAFHVVAFGGGGFVREEKAAIERAGLGSSFTFFPFTPDVAGALKAVDVVVIPSLWEASSLLGMEAMVAGVPIIGTSCIGLSEVLADTPATIVPPADGAALAEAVIREARTSSHAVAAAFVPQAVARFDVADRVPELLALMQELVGPAAADQLRDSQC